MWLWKWLHRSMHRQQVWLNCKGNFGPKTRYTTLLRNILVEDITSKDVYDAAVAGDKVAIEIAEFRNTRRSICRFCGILRPQKPLSFLEG